MKKGFETMKIKTDEADRIVNDAGLWMVEAVLAC